LQGGDSSEKASPSEATSSFQELVTDMFDALKFSALADSFDEKAVLSQHDMERQISRVDDFKFEVMRALDRLRVETPGQVNAEISESLIQLLQESSSKAKASLSKRLEQTTAECASRSKTERAKAFKSLEAFLAASPLPELDMVVSVKYTDSEYEAKQKESSEGGIEYEFTIDLKPVKMFQKKIDFYGLGKELRIPVETKKGWGNKDKAVFEDASNYVMDSAELSRDSLVLDLAKPDSERRARITYSRVPERRFVSVEVSGQEGMRNITADPLLSKSLDAQSLQNTMEWLWASFSKASLNKKTLTSLRLDGDEQLARPNIPELFKAVMRVMMPAYQSVINSMYAGPSKSGGMDIHELRKRVKDLGTASVPVAEALGLPRTD